jgi:hypothetical protein
MISRFGTGRNVPLLIIGQLRTASWADVVIIGAGPTGAAAITEGCPTKRRYHRKGDPAGQASAAMAEILNCCRKTQSGPTKGLHRAASNSWKSVTPMSRQRFYKLSARQASPVLGLALRNRDLLKETILNEGIACDFSPKGWLHLAADEREEQGLATSLARCQHGRIAIWSRSKIARNSG